MNQEKIGKYIQEKRKELKLTQLELASRLGVSEKTISNWENGRNMPDLSLFNPLCEELNISINELMKGEKIDNDNYQKVFEENLVNTIDYSNKKTNKKFKQIVVFVILLFVILLSFILFNTKSELVNSDTYPIYQEVHINNKITIPVIEEYILNNIKMEENDTLKNFTSFEIFSVEQKKENYYYVYAWVLEQSYESNGEVLYEQSGSSYPCRFELYKENNTYKVINSDMPRDGNLYVEDLKVYFPKYVRDKIDKVHDGNKSVYKKLNDDILNQAKKFFHLN